MVLVAMVLACIGAFIGFRTQVGQELVCLGQRVVSFAASGCGEGAVAGGPKAADPGDVKCDRMGVCTGGGNCFEAGTLVLTEDGERPIESVREGDLVFARDPDTSVSGYRRVLWTKTRRAQPVVSVSVRKRDGSFERIGVTANHPFYVEARGWVSAEMLEAGDRLASTSGDTLAGEVAALALSTQTKDVYNFEVEGLHTYFVGRAHVLVHNQCRPPTQDGWNRAWSTTDAQMVVDARKSNERWSANVFNPNPGPSMHAPGFNVAAAREQSIAQLFQSQSNVNQTMMQILYSPASDPRAKLAIAQQVLKEPGGGIMFAPSPFSYGGGGGMRPTMFALSKSQADANMAAEFAMSSQQGVRMAVLAYAAESRDPQVRAEALAKLAPTSVFNPNRVHDLYGERLKHTFERAQSSKEHSGVKLLAQLLTAQQMAKDPKYAPMIDQKKLDMKVKLMSQDPAVLRVLEGLHKDTLADVKRSPEYQQHLAMVYSDSFLHRLELESPENAKKVLESEIGKIAAVDPQQAQAALNQVVGRQVMRDFGRLPEDEQAAALGESLALHLSKHDAAMAGYVKFGPKATSDVLKRVAAVLKAQQGALAANRTAEAIEAIDKIVENSALDARDKGLFKKALGLIEKGDKYGGISSVAATAGVIALGLEIHDGTAFKSWEKGLGSTASLAKTVGSADSFAKLGAYASFKFGGRASADLAKTGRFASALKIAKFAGPLGDGITAGLELHSAYKNINAGKFGEATCDVGAAGCAVATTIAGIAIASGSTGPAAPVVMLVGTVGYLGFKGVKYMTTDSDEEAFLKEIDVYQRPHVTTWDEARIREIHKYANSCTSDRRHCSGPIGEEARRILDGGKPGFDPDGNRLPQQLLPFQRLPSLGKSEAEIVKARGNKFYADHGAAPGSCTKCH
jgi:hypothetical protein